MAKTKVMLMICPQGHSLITLQSLRSTLACPECDQTFDDVLGGVEINSANGDRSISPSTVPEDRRAAGTPHRIKRTRK